MWEIAQYTDRGSRMTNEDRLSVEETGRLLCVTVADGVGGHGGGSTAAAAVTKKMAELFRNMWDLSEEEGLGDGSVFESQGAREKLSEALTEVNRTVVSMQTRACKLQATCVTLWLEYLKDGAFSAVWTHVGDSRLYLFIDGRLNLRTRDHSLAELWKHDPDIKKRRVSRNVIWQAMGEEKELKPDISELAVFKGCRAAFLLCSDGLWECVGENKMTQALRESSTPEEWLAKMREQMKESGKRDYDNNTAAAVFVG